MNGLSVSGRQAARGSSRALIAAVLALSVAGGVGCRAPAVATDARAQVVLAPDFLLDAVDGGRFRLADHRGKSVVVLDFWATWCDPCKLELPHLVALYETHRDRGLVVAAISIDGPESVARVRGEARQLGLPFPVLLDQESRVVALYNPRRSAPFTTVIGRAGHIVNGHEGYTPGDEATLAREIEIELGR